MNRNVRFLLGMLISLPLISAAQTEIYYEDFESGGSSIDLNTTDEGSITNSASNTWLINDVHTGGNGDLSCIGYNFSFTIPNMQDQPVGIANPGGGYMHITSVEAINDGIECGSFIPADGLCNMTETYFAKMNTDLNTSTYDNVEIDLWWACGGSGTNYGEVYYSTDGGSSWTVLNSNMWGSAAWQNSVLSDPALAGQATLRFGFLFANASSFTATDPGFCVDDVRVLGYQTGVVLNAPSIGGGPFCPGEAIDVNYSSSGSFGSGNVFTVEMSDGAGSFASSMDIGSLASTANNGTITCNIPMSAVANDSYRIRIKASDPSMTSVENGSDFTVAPTPEAEFTATVNGVNVNFLNTSNGSTSWTWNFGDGSAESNDEHAQHTYPNSASDYTVTLIAVNDQGCADTTDAVVNITPVGVGELETQSIGVSPNPFGNNTMLSIDLLESKELNIRVLDVLGRQVEQVYNGLVAGNENFTFGADLVSGIYFVEVRESSGKRWVQRIIKK